MRKLLLVMCFAIAGFTMNAQTPKQDTYPHWTISKDVQKIQFKNTEYVPAQAVTGHNDITVSKGVHRTASTVTGRVQTGGTPSFVISKGVAQMQAKRK